MTKTNFDRHLAKHLKDPDFAAQFEKAGEAWDIAIQLTQLREAAGLSQSALARKLKTSQQQISRLESANYEGHSLSMLRRVAEALNARVIVTLQPQASPSQVAESQSSYAGATLKPTARQTRSNVASRVIKRENKNETTTRDSKSGKLKPKASKT